MPVFIPRRPERYYKNRGWVNWSDFLSNDKIQNQKKVFLDYDEFILNQDFIIQLDNEKTKKSIFKVITDEIKE